MAIVTRAELSRLATDLFVVTDQSGKEAQESVATLATGFAFRDWNGKAHYAGASDDLFAITLSSTSNSGGLPVTTQTSGGATVIRKGLEGWYAPLAAWQVYLAPGQTSTALPRFVLPTSIIPKDARGRRLDGVTVTVGGTADAHDTTPSKTVAVNANTGGLWLDYRFWCRVIVTDYQMGANQDGPGASWELSLEELSQAALATVPPVLSAAKAGLAW